MWLRLEGLTRSFDGIPALRAASLDLAAGEVHGLVGENGAGKSTLIRILAGALAPDAGVIRIDGKPVRFAAPQQAAAAGLRFIHQELNLVPAFGVVENVYVGRRYPRRAGVLADWPAMRRRVAALARELAPDLALGVPVARLSPGQQQMAEILRAFLDRARLVVMDEPTGALSEAESARLFAAIGRLRAAGTTVVYVSHRLEEVLALADRVTVLRDGRMVATRAARDLTVPALIALMSDAAPDRGSRPAAVPSEGTPVLELTLPRGRIAVRRGEVVGLYGLIGSGRTRLLRAVWGAGPMAGLGMHLNGTAYRPRSPVDAIRRRLAFVPEDRRAQGLVLDQGVRANATLPLLHRFRRAPSLPVPSRPAERRFLATMGAALGLRHAGPEQPVRRLSGGNQQKLLVGRWFAQDSQLFLLDEPTRGIDVGAKAALHGEIRALAERGAAVLFASSDLREVTELADRVVVMREGVPVRDFAAPAVDPGAILAACYGQP